MRPDPIFIVVLALLVMSSAACSQSPQRLPYQDTSLSTDLRVADLVSRMTLEEKVSQMVNESPAIARLNIPSYNWWNEGLHGVARAGYATLFPQAIGMAATWDVDLVGREGKVISTEARAKYNDAIRRDIHSIYYGLTIWSPNINIFRDPRWGRGQETYGEDPYLTGRLAVSFVKGLQGSDPLYFETIATPKHFAVHSGPESDRHHFNATPSAHDLWDTYLPAFRAAVTEGGAFSIMCAYNAVDGSPACANRDILQGILRGEWGFRGFVTSDCGAIDDFFSPSGHHYSDNWEAASVAAVRAGTDTNCGNTYAALIDAVKHGLIGESEIDTSVKRLFTARYKLGLFDPASKVPFSSLKYSQVHSQQSRTVAIEAARKSIVLLKNDSNTLPLGKKIRTIAVIGPNAVSLAAIEGNYNAVPKNPVLPLAAMEREFSTAKILYSQGAPYAEGAPMPVSRTVLHPAPGSFVQGLRAEYFAGDFGGKPLLTRVDKEIEFDWNSASPAPGIPQDHFSVRWSGTITPPEGGEYDFSMRMAYCYPCHDSEQFTVYLDGAPVAGVGAYRGIDLRPLDPTHFKLRFADKRAHGLKVEYRHNAKLYNAGIALEWVPRSEPMCREAVALAKLADVVVVFVGLSPQLEGEEMPVKIQGFSGGDRTDISLPNTQQHLLEAIAATGKPIVLVLMNGSALAVTWAQKNAKAIVEAWYPGEGGAKAIADVLSGRCNPGGRLPITFYASTSQLPAFNDYSMADRTYRYFHGTPLYQFGYGLSYTRFRYTNLHIESSAIHAGDSLEVSVDLQNIGHRAGDEVAQLYLIPAKSSVSPVVELKGFQRINLAPGERRHLSFTMDPRMLSEVDAQGVRAVTSGTYRISVGGGQPFSEGNDLFETFTIDGVKAISR